MIECKALSCGYVKDQITVRNAEIILEDGKICVLLGLNGSGKTTLLKALSGELPFSAGTIRVDGVDIRSLSFTEKAKKISILPQSLPIPSGITVRQTVSLGRMPYVGHFGRLTDMDTATVDNAIEALGLSSLENEMLSDISGGERQKVFFALVLSKNTKNILLDEPTASLDPQNKRELFKFAASLKASGRAILTVLHDLSDAFLIADSLCVMDQGHTVFFGSKEDFLNKEIAQKHFASRPIYANDGEEKRILFI